MEFFKLSATLFDWSTLPLRELESTDKDIVVKLWYVDLSGVSLLFSDITFPENHLNLSNLSQETSASLGLNRFVLIKHSKI